MIIMFDLAAEAAVEVAAGKACTITKILGKDFTPEEVSEAKVAMKKLVVEFHADLASEHDVKTKLVTNKMNPNKTGKEIGDIYAIMKKLDESDRIPVCLLLIEGLVDMPRVIPEADVNDLPARVAALESCVTSLVDKVESVRRNLKEEIRCLKPTIADIVKAKVNTTSSGPSGQVQVEVPNTEEVFIKPNRRGFLRNKSQNPNQNQHLGSVNQSSPRANSRHDVITGEDNSTDFSAPIDLYVGNIGEGITPDQIKEFMAGKDLNIIECEKISHPEARTQSYKKKVRVRVRLYKHPRFRSLRPARPAHFRQ